jgi:hypothetical protein
MSRIRYDSIVAKKNEESKLTALLIMSGFEG